MTGELASGTVFVQHGRFDPDERLTDGLLERALPAAERQQAVAGNEPVRMRWVARSAARVLLANQLGLDPRTLRFSLGAEGKPYLPGGEVHFNLTHTGRAFALAMRLDAPVGIDLEWRETPERAVPIARRWFSPQHAERIAAAPQDFLAVWTVYEAFGKALGRGLSGGLTDLAFSEGPPWPAPISLAGTDEGWQWHALELPECAGALVSAGSFATSVREVTLAQLLEAPL